jgi:hypothetical protein
MNPTKNTNYFQFKQTENGVNVGNCEGNLNPECSSISKPEILAVDPRSGTAVMCVYTSNGGGTGNFPTIYFIKSDGNNTSVSDPFDFNDREEFQSVKLSGDEFVVNYLTQGPGDGACCPTTNETIKLMFDGHSIVKAPGGIGKNKSAPQSNTVSSKSIDNKRGTTIDSKGKDISGKWIGGISYVNGNVRIVANFEYEIHRNSDKPGTYGYKFIMTQKALPETMRFNCSGTNRYSVTTIGDVIVDSNKVVFVDRINLNPSCIHAGSNYFLLLGDALESKNMVGSNVPCSLHRISQ